MKKFKQIIKRISVFSLCICLVLSLTGCTDEEMSLVTYNVINTGFSQDTNAANGAQLKIDIEEKFAHYQDTLNKLINLGVVKNGQIYTDAMAENKEYLLNALTNEDPTKRTIDKDIGGSIAWVMDPQYVCKLYNDLSWIQQFLEMENIESSGGYDDNALFYGIFSSDADDLEEDDSDVEASEDENVELDENILNEEQTAWETIQEVLSEDGCSIDDINYTLSVIEGINKAGVKVPDATSKNISFFDTIKSLFSGLTSGSSDGTAVKPFIVLDQGSIIANNFTVMTTNKGVSGLDKKEAPLIQKSVIGVLIDKYKGSSESFLDSYTVREEDGFTIELSKSCVTEDLDSSEATTFNTQKANTTKILKLVMSNYLERAANVGRHCTGYVAPATHTDTRTYMDASNTPVTEYTLTYSVKFNVKTTKAIFLNVTDLAPYLLGDYDENTYSPILYRMASAAITNSGRTLVDIPYVVSSEADDISKYSTIDSVVEDNSHIKGRNVCAPNTQETGNYNTGANTPIRKFQYVSNQGDFSIDEFRLWLEGYDSQTDDVKKTLGEKIYLWTEKPPLGDKQYLETNSNLFTTSNYTKYADNLSYNKVLKSIALGNSGQGGIDYNPEGESGNDLIVTIANIPAFAIRLLEFNETAFLDQADSLDKAVEEGYVIIKTKDHGNFAFDPRCRIDRLSYVDATSNNLYFESSDNYYNFLTNHFFKAEEGNETVPIDGINTADRDLIAQKFTKNNSFTSYFGTAQPGHLTLLGYDPLFYEENDEIVDGNWFPIGRTMFLNRSENMFYRDFRNDPLTLTVKDAYEPIGYLGSASSNLYNKSSGTPIYLADLSTVDNLSMKGEDIERVSYFSEDYLEQEEGQLESNKKDNSKKFTEDTKTAPEGSFIANGDDFYYLISDKPSNTDDYIEWNGKWLLTEGYWYIPSTDGPDDTKRYYLYYIDESGYISSPPDEDYYTADEEYHFKVISDEYEDGFFKPYKNKVDSGKKTNDFVTQVVKFASEVKSTFLDAGGDTYSQTNDCKVDVPIVGMKNSRRDCSSYACILANKIDEIKEFKKMHLYEDDSYYTAALVDQLSISNDTNYTCKNISGVSNSNIASYLKAGDFLIYTADENSASYGHVIFVSNITSSTITIYNWTAGSAKGGPFKIPIVSTDNNDIENGCCIASGNSIKIRIPDPSNSSKNPLYNYYHYIRSKS